MLANYADLHHRILSDALLQLTVSLSIQVYKWVMVNFTLGETLWWTSIRSRGSRNTPSCFILLKPGVSFGLMEHFCHMQTSPFLPLPSINGNVYNFLIHVQDIPLFLFDQRTQQHMLMTISGFTVLLLENPNPRSAGARMSRVETNLTRKGSLNTPMELFKSKICSWKIKAGTIASLLTVVDWYKASSVLLYRVS